MDIDLRKTPGVDRVAHPTRRLQARTVLGLIMIGVASATIVAFGSTTIASSSTEVAQAPMAEPAATTAPPSAAATPALDASVVTSATSIAVAWAGSVLPTVKADVAIVAPASAGTSPDVPLTAVILALPKGTQLPAGVPVLQSRGEGDPPLSLEQAVTDSAQEASVDSVTVLVDVAAKQVFAVEPGGLVAPVVPEGGA